jgi:hypothetical protein
MSASSSAVQLPAGQPGVETSLYAGDYSRHKAQDNFGAWFREASRQTGTRPMRIFLDYFAVRKAAGRLSLQDYFLYRLYDNEKFSVADKRRFISNRLHWPVTRKCCDMTWQATTEDKWLSYTLLGRFGFKIPTTAAVVDASARSYADTEKIATADQFKRFLQSRSSFPLFCKPNYGLGSFGAFIVTGIDGDMVQRDQAEPVAVERLFNAIAADRSYLVQETLQNHSLIRAMTSYVATIRMVNILTPAGVRTPFAALKLPAANNIADNFWRKGNLLANINVNNGTLGRTIRGSGVATEELDTYPDSSRQLRGMQLPFWREVLELNARAVSFLPRIRYNSLDIALTDDGPVIVEMNTGGSFELPQLASGQGLLTDEVEVFFRSCDAPLGK